MLQVNNLSKAYGRQVVFDDISFTINPGERVGLVGRNGHGKTTLFRMITGEEHADSGVIRVPNGYSVGHLSQHLSFSEETVLKEGSLSLKQHEDGRDETYKVETILAGLGFSEEDFNRNPKELSGGYQVRLNLAKILLFEPNLLLLDEPTNYLDIISIRWLVQFLKCWKGEMMLITHDRDFMDSVTTHTMGIFRNKIRKTSGPTHKLYDQILMEEEVHEKTRINEERKRGEVEQFINRFRAQANKAKAVQSRIKALEKKGRLERLSETKNLEFQFNSAPFNGKRLLEADNISFSYNHEGPPLIEGLSLTMGKRDRIAVIGKNGKGKTTLLNLLTGEVPPVTGSMTYHPAMKLAYFGQTNINRLDPGKTVEGEIMDVHPDNSRGEARKICGAMMFEGDSALKKISVLSGGEKSRVLLGKLLVSPANLLVLDEPTNHLDMESIDSLIEALDEFNGAVIIVTHSEMILNAVADRLIVFDEGSVSLFEGSYQDFLQRVGWKSDAVPARDDNTALKQGALTSKKDMRRIRAEIITSKSRTIVPLQRRVEEIEGDIARLEEGLENDTKALLAASVTGDGESIKRLSKSTHDAKVNIDKLLAEWEILSGDIEEKTREFDARLSEAQGTGTEVMS